MAYKLRASRSVKHTANPNIAPDGWRRPWEVRSAGNLSNASINDDPASLLSPAT